MTKILTVVEAHIDEMSIRMIYLGILVVGSTPDQKRSSRVEAREESDISEAINF
jgi:hypothetical protein